METELREAVHAAARRREVGQAVSAVYASLADAIALRKPICSTSGRCCRFEEFGHRLYVTTLELAAFIADAAENSIEPGNTAQLEVANRATAQPLQLPILNGRHSGDLATQAGCPFQMKGLCGVHTIRPFGCRIFFCDETSTQWQHEMYERLHGQLRRLHDELNVPYHYVEWRFALQVCL